VHVFPSTLKMMLLETAFSKVSKMTTFPDKDVSFVDIFPSSSPCFFFFLVISSSPSGFTSFCSGLVYHRGGLVRTPPVTAQLLRRKKKNSTEQFRRKVKAWCGRCVSSSSAKQSQKHCDYDKTQKTENTSEEPLGPLPSNCLV